MEYLILILTGVVVGMINSVAGGGNLICFPVLLSFGLPPIMATATSYITALPGQISSAFGYRQYIKKIPRSYYWMVLPVICGALIGSIFLRNINHGEFNKIAPLFILLSVIVFAVQPYLVKIIQNHTVRQFSQRTRLVVFGLLLIVVTIYGGFFGIGLGFALLAILGLTHIGSVHTMNGAKNIITIITSAVAIAVVASVGIIHWHYGLIVAVGSLAGGYIGSNLAQKYIPIWAIRFVAITIGLVTSIYMFMKYL